MADHSHIEWTDATWNPIVGCSLVSPGCTNCYAMSMARRIEAMQAGTHYAGTTQVVNGYAVWTGKVALAPEHILTQPLRWRRARKIFVNSMGDLFHEDVPDEWIDRVFAIMALTPQHTYQVLTKRSARMREYLANEALYGRVHDVLFGENHFPDPMPKLVSVEAASTNLNSLYNPGILPNVWLGVSAEDQRRADERRDDLAALAATGWRTFVSYEPALGPVDWTGWEFLSWLISGGENGPRPSHPDWHRAARDFCAAHGIPYFFKQWGTWLPALDRDMDDPDWRAPYAGAMNDRRPDIAWLNLAGGCGFHGARFHVMRRAGKAQAGRLLDGREHNAMPGGRP